MANILTNLISGAVHNPYTSVLGVIGAVGNYLQVNGMKIPHTMAEWGVLGFSVVIAALGLSARDAKNLETKLAADYNQAVKDVSDAVNHTGS